MSFDSDIEREIREEIAKILGEPVGCLVHINKQQTAKVLHVEPSTLDAWACTGRNNIPYFKIGRNRIYRMKDVVNALIRMRMGEAA